MADGWLAAGPDEWTEGQLATEGLGIAEQALAELGRLCVLGTLVERETSRFETRTGCTGVQAGLR